MTAFADRLTRAMADRGLSQAQLAGLTRLDRSLICRLRSGKRPPTARAVHRLAAALNFDPAELLPGIELNPIEDLTEAQLVQARAQLETEKRLRQARDREIAVLRSALGRIRSRLRALVTGAEVWADTVGSSSSSSGAAAPGKSHCSPGSITPPTANTNCSSSAPRNNVKPVAKATGGRRGAPKSSPAARKAAA